MKKRWLPIPLLGLAAAGVLWWSSCEPDLVPGAPPEGPGAQLDRPFVHTGAGEGAFDAGVGRVTGRVVNEDLKPVSGARVRLFAKGPEVEELECGTCRLTVLDCEDPSTVRRVIQGLRDGSLRPPVPVAELVTGADGTFAFEDAPLGGEVVAVAGKLSAAEASDSEAMELVLEPPLVQELHVLDFEGGPLPSARVTLYSPLDGTLEERRVDAEGRVTLESLDHRAWFFAEADGTLPVGHRLDRGGEVVLAPPRTLIVHTRMGGPARGRGGADLHARRAAQAAQCQPTSGTCECRTSSFISSITRRA